MRAWYSIYQFTCCFAVQTSDYDVIIDFRVIGDVIQKVQRHHDLIKAHAVRKTTFIRQRATVLLI